MGTARQGSHLAQDKGSSAGHTGRNTGNTRSHSAGAHHTGTSGSRTAEESRYEKKTGTSEINRREQVYREENRKEFPSWSENEYSSFDEYEAPAFEKKAKRKSSADEEYSSRKLPSGKKPAKKRIGVKVLLVLVAFGLFFGIGGVGAFYEAAHGPSYQIQVLFVKMTEATVRLRWLPRIFYSEEEIAERMNYGEDAPRIYSFERPAVAPEPVPPSEPDPDREVIEIVEVTGKTYHGKILLVHDPSLVILATPKDTRATNYSHFYSVEEYIDMYGAIGGMCAGGYVPGDGDYHPPYGYVFSDGEMLFKGNEDICYNMVGIDDEGKLFVDTMWWYEAEERAPKYAVCWGPILVKDGVKVEKFRAENNGITARCGIGQTMDGTILMAVLEGRRANSPGATAADLADLMEEYGAINAINLDSGHSSVLYYNGEKITHDDSGRGTRTSDRNLPNAFLILPEKES